MKKTMLFASCFLALNQAYAVNMAYVEVNSNPLSNVGCYVDSKSKQPFFQIASIFAANINGDDPNDPYIFLNEQVAETLLSTQIADLHQKGIKVVVTLLGNHQNAGWSCVTDADAAQLLANNIVDFADRYQLDGIDIDDEYSTCKKNPSSLTMITKNIKSHPAFKGKILTKALHKDFADFHAEYQGHHLSEYLDYGFEMSYGNPQFARRLQPYFELGMASSQLMIGSWTENAKITPYEIGQYTLQNQLAGVMVYDVKNDSENYLSSLQQGLSEGQSKVEVLPNCLA